MTRPRRCGVSLLSRSLARSGMLGSSQIHAGLMSPAGRCCFPPSRGLLVDRRLSAVSIPCAQLVVYVGFFAMFGRPSHVLKLRTVLWDSCKQLPEIGFFVSLLCIPLTPQGNCVSSGRSNRLFLWSVWPFLAASGSHKKEFNPYQESGQPFWWMINVYFPVPF